MVYLGLTGTKLTHMITILYYSMKQYIE